MYASDALMFYFVQLKMFHHLLRLSYHHHSGVRFPKAVKLFGAVLEGTTLRLVLELCTHGSLRDFLYQPKQPRMTPLTVGQRLALCADMCGYASFILV
jgi:hypothetical protein